jgi:mannose-6-phosphate isomerase
MTPLGPLPLRPILHPRAWGGDRLRVLRRGAEIAAHPAGEPIGESWELADLPEQVAYGRSGVSSGPFAGRTLHDLLTTEQRRILGLATPRADGAVPLLLKVLDSREPLSIQVHPSPAYAARHPGTAEKHEGWLVLDAGPQACIHRGFVRDLDRGAVAEAVRSGGIRDLLQREPVRRGDFVWLPSGTCHALGGDLLVAEIQTPSDTTFRVDDWGRQHAHRPLHLEEAIEAIDGRAAAALPPIVRTLPGGPPSGAGPIEPRPIEAAGFRTFDLHRSPWFSIELIDATAGSVLPMGAPGAAVAWMLLEGEATIAPETDAGPFEPLALQGIATVLQPAAMARGAWRMATTCRLLRIPLAQPLDTMLAGVVA